MELILFIGEEFSKINKSLGDPNRPFVAHSLGIFSIELRISEIVGWLCCL